MEENANVNYYQIGKIQMTLSEGLEDIRLQPFLVDRETGAVSLNFDPQRGMKGYFDFMVSFLYFNIYFIYFYYWEKICGRSFRGEIAFCSELGSQETRYL